VERNRVPEAVNNQQLTIQCLKMKGVTMSKFKQVRPLLGFSGVSDDALQTRATAVHDAMTNNPAYPNPPVDLKAFKAALDIYSAAVAAALDGGQKAITAREVAREPIVQMLRHLGAYVRATCKGDSSVFSTSGFAAAASSRAPTQPLDQPVIRRIDQGITGQLLVSLPLILGARAYEIRFAVLSNGVPGPWTTKSVTAVKTPAPFDNLTPGTAYAFQVRALGRLGFTSWSDSTTRICI
jgi:hypothetical protein